MFRHQMNEESSSITDIFDDDWFLDDWFDDVFQEGTMNNDEW